MRYRLLRGKHSHGKHPDGSNITYVKGDIFDSSVNLHKLIDHDRTKFQLVDEHVILTKVKSKSVLKKEQDKEVELPQGSAEDDKVIDPTTADDGLDDLSIKELRAMATEDEIDLGEAKSKSDIINVIRSAFV